MGAKLVIGKRSLDRRITTLNKLIEALKGSEEAQVYVAQRDTLLEIMELCGDYGDMVSKALGDAFEAGMSAAQQYRQGPATELNKAKRAYIIEQINKM
jgi:hypothetical protein